MKDLFRVGILVCLLALQVDGAWAQTMPFSQVVRHNTIEGKEVITRASDENLVLTCIKSDDSYNNHTFLQYSPLNGNTYLFTCNLGALFSSSLDDYSIKDMYLFEHKCYFCGTVKHRGLIPMEPYGMLVPGDKNGFVGYFDLRDMYISTGTIFLMELPQTDSIMQMVVHHDYPSGYDAFIMAVGYTSDYPLSTCVVELTKPVGGINDTIWSLKIMQPACAETDEYMTDIVLTEDNVVVASKIPYADGGLDGDTDPTHYLFRLHETKRDGFYSTIVPPPSSASVYEYDVSSYGNGVGCHHIGDPIRLCPLNGNRFCVYYNCEQRLPPVSNGVGGTTLFWMNGANLMEHAAKVYGFIFSHTKEAVWIGDTYKTIALLQSDICYFPEGEVIFPTIHPNPNSYGACLAQRIQGVNLHSIDCKAATQYLYIGGTDATKKLWHGIQDELNYCNNSPGCLNYFSNSFSLIDPQETEAAYCQWAIEYSNDCFKAKRATIEPTTCEREIICTEEIDQ